MRLLFVISLFLPALLINGRRMDEDEPSNSNQDKEEITTADLPDSSEPGKGQEKEINEGVEWNVDVKMDCVAGHAFCTMKRCHLSEKCISCSCKSKHTGKTISFMGSR